MTPSWRLKLYRAEEHLSRLKEITGLPIGRHPYPVSEILNGNGEYEYRLYFPSVPESIPIIAGDFLFNVRSGLDHLFSAFIPGDDKGRAQFPIFTNNPLELEEATGKYLRPWAYGAWKAQTTGVPDDIIAIVTEMQPWYQALQAKVRAEDHTLAILATLQNTDKHSQLTFLGPTLNHTMVTVEGFGSIGVVPGYHHGALIHTSPHKVKVDAEGEIGIPFGVRRDEGYEYPRTFDAILNFVAVEVVPTLESRLSGNGSP